MQDRRQVSCQRRSPAAAGTRLRAAKPFCDTKDFLARIGRHEARVRASEQKSLRDLSAGLHTTKTARTRIVAGWLAARLLLAQAVQEIDAVIEVLGLGLSMIDDVTPAALLGAVEIRLFQAESGSARATLDIEVGLDGHHSTRVLETQRPVQVQLPSIAEVSQDDYRTLLMTFVDDVARAAVPRTALLCPHCAQPTLRRPYGSQPYEPDEL